MRNSWAGAKANPLLTRYVGAPPLFSLLSPPVHSFPSSLSPLLHPLSLLSSPCPSNPLSLPLPSPLSPNFHWLPFPFMVAPVPHHIATEGLPFVARATGVLPRTVLLPWTFAYREASVTHTLDPVRSQSQIPTKTACGSLCTWKMNSSYLLWPTQKVSQL